MAQLTAQTGAQFNARLLLRVGITLLIALVFTLNLSPAAAQQNAPITIVPTASQPRSGDPDLVAVPGRDTFKVTVTLTGASCPTQQRTSPVDVVLLIDVSNSMNGSVDAANDPATTRLDAVKEAAKQFISRFNLGNNDDIRDQIAIVTFSTTASLVIYPDEPAGFTRNVNKLNNAIDGLEASLRTNIAAGLEKVTDLLQGPPDIPGGPNSAAAKVIVVLTDAKKDESGDPVEILNQANRARTSVGARIVTIAFGNEVDRDLMQQLANSPSEDNFFEVLSTDQLRDTYDKIASLVQPYQAVTELSVNYTLNNGFTLVPDTISPPASVNGSVIQWTGLGNLNQGQSRELQFDVQGQNSGQSNVGQVEATFSACDDLVNQITTPPEIGPSVNILAPTPMPTATLTHTLTPSPTSSPTPIPTPPRWAGAQDSSVRTVPTQEGVNGALCQPGILDLLPWLATLLVLIIGLLWVYRRYRKLSGQPQAGCRDWLCLLVALLLVLYLAFLAFLFLQPVASTICPIPESIYFWRMDGTTSGIFITNDYLQGDQPAQLTSLNNTGCVGCHAISSTSQRIAAVHGPIPGSLILSDLEGNIIPPSTPLTAVYVNFSPDGKRLAVTTSDAELYILDDLAGQERHIAAASDAQYGALMPTWSSDGTTIYYVRAPRYNIVPAGYAIENTSEIYRIAADGSGAPEPVLQQADLSGLNYYPSVSPNGRWIAFSHSESGSTYINPASDIWLYDLDSQQSHPIESNYPDASDSWATWNQDGTRLAFSTKGVDPSYDIAVVNVSGDGVTSPNPPTLLAGASIPGVFEHLPYWGIPAERIPLVDQWKPLLPYLLPLLLLIPAVVLCMMFKPRKLVTGGGTQPPPPPPQPPPPLDPLNLQRWEGINRLWEPEPALVIGLGAAGWHVLTQLKKTISDAGLGVPSNKVRLLGVIAGEQKNLVDGNFGGLQLDKDEIIEWSDTLQPLINDAGSDSAIRRWLDTTYLNNFAQSVSNPRQGFQGIRMLGRLALINNLRGNNQRTGVSLWDRLKDAAAQVKDDDNLTVLLVSDISDDVGSGAVMDIGYLIKRLRNEPSVQLNTVRLVGHLLTGRASGGIRQVDEVLRSVNTAATLRELGRFQLAGAAPFPMRYGRDSASSTPFDGTSRGVLFDEIYVHDSVSGSSEPQFAVYPAVADSIALWLDSSAKRGALAAWRDETLRTIRDAQIADKQVMIGGMGIYQYRLPFADLLEQITLRYASEVNQRLLMGQSEELPSLRDDLALERFTHASNTRELARDFLLEGLGRGEWSAQWRELWRTLPAQDESMLEKALNKAKSHIDADTDNVEFKKWLDAVVILLLNGRKPTVESAEVDILEKRGAKIGYVDKFLEHLGDERGGLLTLYANRIEQLNADHPAVEQLRSFAAIVRALRDDLRKIALGLGVEGSPESLHRHLEERTLKLENRLKSLTRVKTRHYVTTGIDSEGKEKPLSDLWYSKYMQDKIRNALQQIFWVMEDGKPVLMLRLAGKSGAEMQDIRFNPSNVAEFEDALIELGKYFGREVRNGESLAQLMNEAALHRNNIAKTTKSLQTDSQVMLRVTDIRAPRMIRGYVFYAAQNFGAAAETLINNLRGGLMRPEMFKVLTNDDPSIPFDPFTLTLAQTIDGIPLEAVSNFAADNERYFNEVYAIQAARPVAIFDSEMNATLRERNLQDNLQETVRLLHPVIVTALAQPTSTEVYLLAVAGATTGALDEWREDSRGVVFSSAEVKETVLVAQGERINFSRLVDGLLRFNELVNEETAQTIWRRYKNNYDLLDALEDWEQNKTSLWLDRFALRDGHGNRIDDPILNDLISVTRLAVMSIL